MRKLISPAFSDRALTAQEPLLTSYVDKLLLVLRERVLKSPSGVVNIVKWYKWVFANFPLQDSSAKADTVTRRLTFLENLHCKHLVSLSYFQ